MDNDRQQRFYREFGDACGKAAEFLALEDVEGANEEELDTIYVDRNHCAVCQVKSMLSVVWPVVQGYINELETELGSELTRGA